MPNRIALAFVLAELAAGGIAKEINAPDVDQFLAEVTPTTATEQTRFDLAVEVLDDIAQAAAHLGISVSASTRRILPDLLRPDGFIEMSEETRALVLG